MTCAAIARARHALTEARSGTCALTPNDFARTAYVGCRAAVCRLMGLGVAFVERQLAQPGTRSADRDWCKAALARRYALYLASTTFDVSQAELGRVVGLNRAAVCIALRVVEMSRDQAAVDALLDAAAHAVVGREPPKKPSLQAVLRRGAHALIGGNDAAASL